MTPARPYALRAVRSRIGPLAAATAMLIVAGCGSRADFSVGTTQTTGDQSLGQTVITSPTTSGPASGQTPDGGTVTSTVPTTGSGLIAKPTGPASPGATHTAPTASTPSAPVKRGGPPIRVGFVIQDASGANALLGTAVPTTSNARQEQIAKWLVAYVNSHGGVAGRKIVPSFKAVSATSTEQSRVASCQAMAQDQHLEAVIDANEYLEDDGWACFARNHVDYLGNATGTDEAFMASHAPYVTTTDMALNRQMAAAVSGANQLGFLKGQKVGVILPDTPEAHNDYARVMGPALSHLGISPNVRYISGTNETSLTAQTDNAELAFATSGVKRIFFFENIIVYLAFTSEASSEHYHPLYAFPDFEEAAGIAAFYGSAQTNAGSIAISATPSSVPPNANQDTKNAGTVKISRKQSSPGQRKCLDILSKASHVDFYDPKQSQDPLLDAFYYCDELFLFVKAASALGADYSPATFGQGLAQVGSYDSDVVNSTDFTKGRYDGASSYAVGRYNAKCSCFVRATSWIAGP
ncbi:MAG TPA: hypothetical protein VHC43_11975 [Mycobacteriales bacterium]|nr:hypothetical protein [Mycobacteriales bacterium]